MFAGQVTKQYRSNLTIVEINPERCVSAARKDKKTPTTCQEKKKKKKNSPMESEMLSFPVISSGLLALSRL